jgi:hypothetical protein
VIYNHIQEVASSRSERLLFDCKRQHTLTRSLFARELSTGNTELADSHTRISTIIELRQYLNCETATARSPVLRCKWQHAKCYCAKETIREATIIILPFPSPLVCRSASSYLRQSILWSIPLSFRRGEILNAWVHEVCELRFCHRTRNEVSAASF